MDEATMLPFRRILFPVDFSEAAVAMVPYVAEIAQRFSATVIVLNAFNLVHDYNIAAGLGPFDSSRVSIPYTDAMQELRTQRQTRLEDFCNLHFSSVNHLAKVEDGDPAMVIEWVARHENAGLIMMPTKGLGRFRRLLLGSVTAKVLHDVSCPVMTSAHMDDAAPAPPTGYRSIVCAVELEPESRDVLKAAGFLARAYGANLTLLHIENFHDRGERVSAESISRAFQDAGGSDAAADVMVLNTGVAEGIRRVAIEKRVDLVVVGRGRQTGISRMWSHLYTIITESPCPVLSV